MSAHTFATMGTVVSIRLAHTEPDDPGALEAVREAHSVFERLNERFSLYRDDSELSAIARGDLMLNLASDDLRSAYERAIEWRNVTSGDFTPHRPDGVIDLNGIIKAEAIALAAETLRSHGFGDFSVNCGGDVLVSGSPSSGTWLTGIVDPSSRDEILTTVSMDDEWSAIATSSVSERGEHIWSRPDSDQSFAQVSVVAHDIVTADVLATAIMAGGQRALDDAVSRWSVAALAVTRDGELRGNARFRELVAR